MPRSPFALRLTFVAMDGGGMDPGLFEAAHDAVRAMLGA